VTAYALPWRPSDARLIGERSGQVVLSARELASFYEREPDLAARAGVETLALEAKMILRESPRAMSGRDLDAVQRLEGLVRLASGRIDACIASMDQAADREADPINQLAGVIGMANGAFGLLSGLRGIL
jgi:hypothetical protein